MQKNWVTQISCEANGWAIIKTPFTYSLNVLLNVLPLFVMRVQQLSKASGFPCWPLGKSNIFFSLLPVVCALSLGLVTCPLASLDLSNWHGISNGGRRRGARFYSFASMDVSGFWMIPAESCGSPPDFFVGADNIARSQALRRNLESSRVLLERLFSSEIDVCARYMIRRAPGHSAARGNMYTIPTPFNWKILSIHSFERLIPPTS